MMIGDDKSQNLTETVEIGSKAPFFKGIQVFKGQFKNVSLNDFVNKYLVLFFYPYDFSLTCPSEICTLSDLAVEFQDLNCELLCISTDSHYSHLAWMSTSRQLGGIGDLELPLMSDKTMGMSRDYRVLNESEGVAFRSLFILDKNHIIRHIYYHDMVIARCAYETMRLITASQSTDSESDSAPVNLIQGRSTIPTDLAQAKKYFEALYRKV